MKGTKGDRRTRASGLNLGEAAPERDREGREGSATWHGRARGRKAQAWELPVQRGRGPECGAGCVLDDMAFADR